VNYDQPAKNVSVRVNLDGVAEAVNAKSLRVYSPDAVPKTASVTNATGKIIEFQLPELGVYSIVTFN
jgi:hypothetical protein